AALDGNRGAGTERRVRQASLWFRLRLRVGDGARGREGCAGEQGSASDVQAVVTHIVDSNAATILVPTTLVKEPHSCAWGREAERRTAVHARSPRHGIAWRGAQRHDRADRSASLL